MGAIPTLDQIRDAEAFLRKYFQPTPLQAAPSLSCPDSPAYLKIETVLPTGSFKPRGALYALSARMTSGKLKEVVASSTGNHGAAVSWAAKTLSVPVTIFLPAKPNPVKRANIAGLGARIVEVGGDDLVHATAAAHEYSQKDGVYFLNDAIDETIVAGPATIGLEILTQLPSVAAIYVPMGDSALIRGIGAAIKQLAPHVKMIGVQTERAPSYVLSWREGRAIPTETCDTCADGLATRVPHPDNVAAIRQLVDDVRLVSEEEMIAAVGRLYREEKVTAEPAGAAATAAFLKERSTSGPTVLLVTGANITPALRQRAGLPAS